MVLLARNMRCEKSLFATGTYAEPTSPYFAPHSFTHSMELLALMLIYPSGPDDKNRSVHVDHHEDDAVTASPVLNAQLQTAARYRH